MKSTDNPSLIETVIASKAPSTYVRTIPKTQTKSGSGEMSLALGWPPECAIPVAAGGKYPQMADANGVLNLLSAAVQQLQARFMGSYNADFATAIGGYPLNAIVSDTKAGQFWVSTAEDNTTVPGTDGASWQSLFDGYATQAWANGQFLQLALDTLQIITGPVAFGGQTTVPDVTDFTGENALNAKTAEGRYPASVPATGQTRVTSLVQDANRRTLSNGAVLANLADIPIPLDQKIQYFTATHTSPGGHTVQFPVVFPEAFSSPDIMVIGFPFGENTPYKPLLLPNIEPGTETSTGLRFRIVGLQAGGTFDPPAGMVMTMNVLAIGPK